MIHNILIEPIARKMYERRVTIVVVWSQQISCANDIDYYI
jgi:hypothetical protein